MLICMHIWNSNTSETHHENQTGEKAILSVLFCGLINIFAFSKVNTSLKCDVMESSNGIHLVYTRAELYGYRPKQSVRQLKLSIVPKVAGLGINRDFRGQRGTQSLLRTKPRRKNQRVLNIEYNHDIHYHNLSSLQRDNSDDLEIVRYIDFAVVNIQSINAKFDLLIKHLNDHRYDILAFTET